MAGPGMTVDEVVDVGRDQGLHGGGVGDSNLLPECIAVQRSSTAAAKSARKILLLCPMMQLRELQPQTYLDEFPQVAAPYGAHASYLWGLTDFPGGTFCLLFLSFPYPSLGSNPGSHLLTV